MILIIAVMLLMSGCLLLLTLQVVKLRQAVERLTQAVIDERFRWMESLKSIRKPAKVYR